MQLSFKTFFKTATDHDPYEYQCRLACGEPKPGDNEAAWLRGGSKCESKLINIPTGLGKTAAVVMAWLWNRIGKATQDTSHKTLDSSNWPRRLVYCLPMLTLEEPLGGQAHLHSVE